MSPKSQTNEEQAVEISQLKNQLFERNKRETEVKKVLDSLDSHLSDDSSTTQHVLSTLDKSTAPIIGILHAREKVNMLRKQYNMEIRSEK